MEEVDPDVPWITAMMFFLISKVTPLLFNSHLYFACSTCTLSWKSYSIMSMVDLFVWGLWSVACCSGRAWSSAVIYIHDLNDNVVNVYLYITKTWSCALPVCVGFSICAKKVCDIATTFRKVSHRSPVLRVQQVSFRSVVYCKSYWGLKILKSALRRFLQSAPHRLVS